MVSIRKMKKQDLPVLYEIAEKAFRPDYERYGVYPPLLDVKRKKMTPPRMFGKVIVAGGEVVGGAYVAAMGGNGTIGAVFINPEKQQGGYGRQAMLAIETAYPKVKKWRLETPAESTWLHHFYQSLGYKKMGEMKDDKSGMVGFIYEKAL